MTPITIPLSKIKLTFLFLGCAGLTAWGIWMYLNPFQNFEYGPTTYKYLGMALAIIGGIASLSRLRWLVSTDPALMITNEGILDHCSAVKVGLIRWENITGVEIDVLKAKNARNRILVIRVNNMDELLKDKHLFIKLRIWLNAPWGKDKIRIHTSMFKMRLNELKELIENHWRQHTNHHSSKLKKETL